MKITFDGTKLFTTVKESDGFHIYIEESNAKADELDILKTVKREDFKPNPILELYFPRERTLPVMIASLLLICDRHEIVRAFAEFEKNRGTRK